MFWLKISWAAHNLKTNTLSYHLFYLLPTYLLLGYIYTHFTYENFISERAYKDTIDKI